MRGITFPQQEKPIYIWKLNLDGSITKVVIDSYRINHFYKENHYLFRFAGSSTIHSMRDAQMDRYVNQRYGSFEDDDKKAIKSIEDCLMAKAQKCKTDYENATKMLELLRKKN